MERHITKKIKVGRLEVGGDAPISVESMTTTDTKDVEATIKQVMELENAGCDIVRLAVYDLKCIDTISELKKHTLVPLVADIHFDYRLAIASIEKGIDKVRINPGNIGKAEGVHRLVAAAKERNIPIRIGVNAGSLKDEIVHKYGNTPQAMVESALEHVALLESAGYDNIVLSLKASNVIKTVDAYRKISKMVNYPLHIGITEAGAALSGIIKSSIGIGALLLEGIGDTLRVSLTASPLEEVKVGIEILKSVGLRNEGVELISCPTCGRCSIDLIQLVNTLQNRLQSIKYPIKVAVMGCAVNGPGEAKECDIGIACGKGNAVLFKRGQTVGTLPIENIVETLISEIKGMIKDGRSGDYTRI